MFGIGKRFKKINQEQNHLIRDEKQEIRELKLTSHIFKTNTQISKNSIKRLSDSFKGIEDSLFVTYGKHNKPMARASQKAFAGDINHFLTDLRTVIAFFHAEQTFFMNFATYFKDFASDSNHSVPNLSKQLFSIMRTSYPKLDRWDKNIFRQVKIGISTCKRLASISNNIKVDAKSLLTVLTEADNSLKKAIDSLENLNITFMKSKSGFDTLYSRTSIFKKLLDQNDRNSIFHDLFSLEERILELYNEHQEEANNFLNAVSYLKSSANEAALSRLGADAQNNITNILHQLEANFKHFNEELLIVQSDLERIGKLR